MVFSFFHYNHYQRSTNMRNLCLYCLMELLKGVLGKINYKCVCVGGGHEFVLNGVGKTVL